MGNAKTTAQSKRRCGNPMRSCRFRKSWRMPHLDPFAGARPQFQTTLWFGWPQRTRWRWIWPVLQPPVNLAVRFQSRWVWNCCSSVSSSWWVQTFRFRRGGASAPTSPGTELANEEKMGTTHDFLAGHQQHWLSYICYQLQPPLPPPQIYLAVVDGQKRRKMTVGAGGL